MCNKRFFQQLSYKRIKYCTLFFLNIINCIYVLQRGRFFSVYNWRKKKGKCPGDCMSVCLWPWVLGIKEVISLSLLPLSRLFQVFPSFPSFQVAVLCRKVICFLETVVWSCTLSSETTKLPDGVVEMTALISWTLSHVKTMARLCCICWRRWLSWYTLYCHL